MVISLLTCSVKMVDSKEDRFCFLLLTSDDTLKFYAENQEEILDWVNAIQSKTNSCTE
jgi:hypothetical protein